MKKTNYSYIGIAFIILIFGILFVPKIVDRVSNGDVIRKESRSDQKTKPSELLFIANNGEKRKVPNFEFTNQNGETISNKDYEGKVYVVEFFFTTCPTICPKMNLNLVKIQNEFSAFKNFGVASFTINPDYDTVRVLKDYAETYHITNPNWHLLTGAKDEIYNLAKTGFFIYAAKNDAVAGGFEHSGNFALVDKNGFIRCREDKNGNPIIYYNGIVSEEEQIDDNGVPEQITALKEDIKKLLNE